MNQSYIELTSIFYPIFFKDSNLWGEFKGRESPGWYDSVDQAPAHKPKGHRFDSQSGHMLGFQARSPFGGVQEATNGCIFHTSMLLSLSFFLPFSLKINKIFKKRQRKFVKEIWQILTLTFLYRTKNILVRDFAKGK